MILPVEIEHLWMVFVSTDLVNGSKFIHTFLDVADLSYGGGREEGSFVSGSMHDLKVFCH